jgi:hypothetical protein
MAERCWKCASAIGWNAAIGAFCTNPDCDVLDALDSEETFEVRILLETVPAAVSQGAPKPALVRSPGFGTAGLTTRLTPMRASGPRSADAQAATLAKASPLRR